MYMYMSAVNVPKNKVEKVELHELGVKIPLHPII